MKASTTAKSRAAAPLPEKGKARQGHSAKTQHFPSDEDILSAVKEFIDRSNSPRAWTSEALIAIEAEHECLSIVQKFAQKFEPAEISEWMRAAATSFAEAFRISGTERDLAALGNKRKNGNFFLSASYVENLVGYLMRFAGRRLGGWKPERIDPDAPIPFNLPRCKPETRETKAVVEENTERMDDAAEILLFAGKLAFIKLLTHFAARWESQTLLRRRILAHTFDLRPIKDSNYKLDEAAAKCVRKLERHSENSDPDLNLEATITQARKRMHRRYCD